MVVLEGMEESVTGREANGGDPAPATHHRRSGTGPNTPPKKKNLKTTGKGAGLNYRPGREAKLALQFVQLGPHSTEPVVSMSNHSWQAVVDKYPLFFK